MKNAIDRLFTTAVWALSGCTAAAVLFLLGFLVFKGIPTVTPSLLFGDTPWFKAVTGQEHVFKGIWPALAGTISLIVLTAIIAVPIGIAAGIYFSEYASKRFRSFIGIGIDLLSGVPSIVMGLFGFTLILFLRKTFLPDANTSLLLASFCLALLVLPYIIRATVSAFESLPEEIRLVGPSLGYTRVQNITAILIPCAGRGILSGMILSIGRIAEDAAVIMLTGAVMGAGFPWKMTQPFEALPFRIFYISSEYRSTAELNQGFGTALVLLMLTALLFMLAFWLRWSLQKKWIR